MDDTDFQRAARELALECDREASELIRAGVAPWTAARKAVETVLARRRRANREQRIADASTERSA
jgi:Xaa-Pro aminopeptidase